MRILNQDNDKAIKNVLILLTQEEAAELKDDLERMLQGNIFHEHTHINDMGIEHELTVAIYDSLKIECLNERIKKLVLEDG
ncbi:MAG: hypothetical protein VR68_12315 [Peptococcaceae bacterium BRH_c4a]|nr:MAG: hypothetical protein VR68_12315 [Peptococcaceae bacterium BRH_c4a]